MQNHTLNIVKTLLILTLITGFFACNQQKEKESQKAGFWLTTLDEKSLLEKSEIEINMAVESEAAATIVIDTSEIYQEIDGFGYTLTGGSALHINKMSDPARKELLQELFGTGENDLGVSYLRLSIGASDLDEAPFSYNDLANGETDENLEKFSLANDTINLIPVLKDILEIYPDIKILGSPWSPPVWMKDNKSSIGGSLKKE